MCAPGSCCHHAGTIPIQARQRQLILLLPRQHRTKSGRWLRMSFPSVSSSKVRAYMRPGYFEMRLLLTEGHVLAMFYSVLKERPPLIPITAAFLYALFSIRRMRSTSLPFWVRRYSRSIRSSQGLAIGPRSSTSCAENINISWMLAAFEVGLELTLLLTWVLHT